MYFEINLVYFEINLPNGDSAMLPVDPCIANHKLVDMPRYTGFNTNPPAAELLRRISDLMEAEDDTFKNNWCYPSYLEFFPLAVLKLTREHPHESTQVLTEKPKLWQHASEEALALLPPELREVSHAL